MPRDHFARPVDGQLGLLLKVSARIGGHRAPATLELLEGWCEQRIVRPMAMPLEGCGGRADFRLELLELTRLRQLRVAFASQNLVNALVLATADVFDELPQLRRIIDRLSRLLAHSCGAALADETRNSGHIPGRD